MRKLLFPLTLALLIFSLVSSSPAYVRYEKSLEGGGPVLSALDLETHDINAVYLMVSNQGPIGLDMEAGNGAGFFPSNTSNNYVFGTGLWFGANYDADADGNPDKVFSQGYNTLDGDSEFREGRGDQAPDDPGTGVFDSTNPSDLSDWPSQFSDPGTGDPIVYSSQDLVTTYTTSDKDPLMGLFQLPLEVNQRSMAVMSPDSMGQVIFLVFEVTNTGDDTLSDAWIGYVADVDVGANFGDDLSSVVFDRVTLQSDTVKLDMGYAWDSDFTESNFTGDPGFVGMVLLLGPGNPDDGIDNDGDGMVDESPFNGVDDDADGETDEWDEVDELGLINFSKFCTPSMSCEVIDPETDPEGYDLLSCDTPGSPVSCMENTSPSDTRFMISSGPFDWHPGESHTFAFAMVFANAVGSPQNLPFVGDPPRPNPNATALGEFMRVAQQARDFFPTLFPTTGIGDDSGADSGVKLPKSFALLQNYPNPFNPVTTIAYDVSGEPGVSQQVELSIFDVRGRMVRQLNQGLRDPGRYEVQWDGTDQSNRVLPTGAYFYRLKVGDYVSTRRMSLVK